MLHGLWWVSSAQGSKVSNGLSALTSLHVKIASIQIPINIINSPR